MVFINATETIGQIISAGTLSLTGSVVATILMVLIFLIVICMMFGIPLEFLAIIILPFCIGIGAYYSDFMVPLIIIIIYLSTLVAKNWIFK